MAQFNAQALMRIRFARNIGSEKGRLMTVEQKYLDKADVLIEALPYIRRFHDKVIVVKYAAPPWSMMVSCVASWAILFF